MESGGKAVTKRYRKKITVALSLVVPVIVLFAILNCFTTYVFYEDYKYKMNLMTEIAAKEEFSGLDAVSELLKDKDIETNEQGRAIIGAIWILGEIKGMHFIRNSGIRLW